MSPTFCIGLLVIDDDIEAVILEGRPSDAPKPRMVVFDYAGNDVPSESILHVTSGAPNAGQTGREVFGVVYLPDSRYPSPGELRSVLDARRRAAESSPLQIARRMRQRVRELDDRLNRQELAPTGEDYNRLYQLAHGGLIDLLKALGDPADFGC